ncbi:MAG: hypothetical protein KAJ19_14095 [Gammaproteobacteria bacterium]|nr:hypothetical protein [Gammaproteobacteria bacterium]
MAAGIFLVTRTIQGVNSDRNGVREIIVNEDDAQTDAQIIAAVIASMNATEPAGDPSGALDQYPAGYFDTVVQIGATPVADLDVDGNYLAFAPRVASLNA